MEPQVFFGGGNHMNHKFFLWETTLSESLPPRRHEEGQCDPEGEAQGTDETYHFVAGICVHGFALRGRFLTTEDAGG